jgi:hypothetical protein
MNCLTGVQSSPTKVLTCPCSLQKYNMNPFYLPSHQLQRLIQPQHLIILPLSQALSYAPHTLSVTLNSVACISNPGADGMACKPCIHAEGTMHPACSFQIRWYQADSRTSGHLHRVQAKPTEQDTEQAEPPNSARLTNTSGWHGG